MGMFENCISLGWYCGTASSMSKLGLRSTSGPFDWYFSDFKGVLKQIETEFVDFMTFENLEIPEDSPCTIIDNKYGFRFLHEIENSFSDDYDSIKKKYAIRNRRFMEMIKKPTCFVRVIRNYDEMSFILHNQSYIDGIIRKSNKDNDIIYACADCIPVPDDLKVFKLDGEFYHGRTYYMRELFSSCKDILQFFDAHFDQKMRERNIEFDKGKQLFPVMSEAINKMIEYDVDGFDSSLRRAFALSYEKPMYIWGGGKYGDALLAYLIKRKFNIAGMIDNDKNCLASDVVDILSPDDIPDGALVFVATSKYSILRDIQEEVKNRSIVLKSYYDIGF